MDCGEDFFSLIAKLQLAGRLESQRAPGPQLGGDFTATTNKIFHTHNPQQQLQEDNYHHHQHNHQQQHQQQEDQYVDEFEQHSHTSSSSSTTSYSQSPHSHTTTSDADTYYNSPNFSPQQQHQQQQHQHHHIEEDVSSTMTSQSSAYLATHMGFDLHCGNYSNTNTHFKNNSTFDKRMVEKNTDHSSEYQQEEPMYENQEEVDWHRCQHHRRAQELRDEEGEENTHIAMRRSSNHSGVSFASEDNTNASKTGSNGSLLVHAVTRRKSSTPSALSNSHHTVQQQQEEEESQYIDVVADGDNCDGFSWFVGKKDRKDAEVLLGEWPSGSFVVREGRMSKVITLKFPVSAKKTFFHVRIQHQDSVYFVAETEFFSSIPELVTFYLNNPSRFFKGMTKDERNKQVLTPFHHLPVREMRQAMVDTSDA